MQPLATQCEPAVLIVDHGSRRTESNDRLLEIVQLFRDQTRFRVVEPAHMELAEPSIAAAFDRCVAQGARLIVVHPYFLLPGRHWTEDIPRLVSAAAAKHPHVGWLVSAPLGVHPLMVALMELRVRQCLENAAGSLGGCDVCSATDRCRFRFGEAWPAPPM